MKAAVVFYSLTGNTRWAAQEIAKSLEGDLIEIRPENAYPDKGFKKFFWGGKSAVMKETPALLPYAFQAEKYGLVVLCTPLWAGTMSPPIRAFLAENEAAIREREKDLAALICCSGGGTEKAFQRIEALAGGHALKAKAVLIDPKDRPGEENKKRLDAFCQTLKG